ncbi:hypothetical protein [Methylobacterium sp. WL19]|uniref:hypothetical protein n=1 Tax=Methylobacterium sp. WL19 TaxID=2603896 RepID=UPI0011C9A93A|nr:hypothetical protein [Methylobacterium sp. WL19]TXN24956.1 hypothetical protein FV220_19695 [Methylobacterium sp. WL19]
MIKQRSNKKKNKGISAADVGRYLKHLSVAMKDPITGNPAMGEALLNLATILAEAKLASVSTAAEKFVDQGGFDFDDEIDFSGLSTEEVQKVLINPALTKAHLIILGAERFGIVRSRLEKLPREEIIKAITAASQHEKSLDIISEEAKRGGQSRSS